MYVYHKKDSHTCTYCLLKPEVGTCTCVMSSNVHTFEWIAAPFLYSLCGNQTRVRLLSKTNNNTKK